MVQWLGLSTSTARGPDSIPSQGAKISQAELHGLEVNFKNKTPVRYHFISTRVAIIKKLVTNIGKDVEKCEESNGNVKCYSCFGKQFGNFLKR